MQVSNQEAAVEETRTQMQVIAEMLEAARAIAHKSLQEQETIRSELADALEQLEAANQVITSISPHANRSLQPLHMNLHRCLIGQHFCHAFLITILRAIIPAVPWQQIQKGMLHMLTSC